MAASCTPEEEQLTLDEGISLSFSTDTVLFDTLFTTLGSITKRVKVYNSTKKAIKIGRMALGNIESSPYNLILNGRSGKYFEDVSLLGGDSLMILVSVTIDPKNQDLPFLVKDSIVFDTYNLKQDVKLISYGQDAHFLKDVILPCDTKWTADRPYVIYNSVIVDSLCQLTIEKGSKIFLNNDAFLYIRGSLKVEGEKDEEVVFQNVRQDKAYKNAPGQWEGIYFLEGSKDNSINYAIIRNGIIGLRVGTPDDDEIPDVIVGNTIIENMYSAGILAFSSDIYAYNVLINNCGDYTVGNFAGGNYTYNHCTLANYNYMFFRQQPSVVFADNFILLDQSLLEMDLKVNLLNSIIWGGLNDELTLSHSGNKSFIFNSSHNIIKTNLTELDINNNVLNTDPRFENSEEYNYLLDTLSPAKDAADKSDVLFDLNGNERGSSPDIGAYERLE